MGFWAVSLGSMSGGYIANLCTSIFTCALICFIYVSPKRHRNIWVCMCIGSGIHKVKGNEIKTQKMKTRVNRREVHIRLQGAAQVFFHSFCEIVLKYG